MSGVPAGLAAELHPGPPTEYVALALYGGPKDGMPMAVVASKDVLGTLRAVGFAGVYQLSGFYRAGNFDYAIYEWNDARP